MKLILMSHDGVIDSEIWLKCQRKLEHNKQIGRGVSSQTTWLGGKISCATYGHTIKITRYSVYRYFVCSGRSNKLICPGINKTIYADEFENMVGKAIEEKLNAFKGANLKVENNAIPQINDIKIKIKEIEDAEKKLTEAIISGGLNDDIIRIINYKSSGYKSEKLSLYDKVDKLRSQESGIKTAMNLSKKWSKSNFEEKKVIANILINKIIINKDGLTEILWNI